MDRFSAPYSAVFTSPPFSAHLQRSRKGSELRCSWKPGRFGRSLPRKMWQVSGSCEAKQLARRLGLAHKPKRALLYLTQKEESCQKQLGSCIFAQYRGTAIPICHFQTGIARQSPFFLQTNTLHLLQTISSSRTR